MRTLNHKESSAWCSICCLQTLCHRGWVGSCDHSNGCSWWQSKTCPTVVNVSNCFQVVLAVPLPQPAPLGIICLCGSWSEQDCCSTGHMCFPYPSPTVWCLVVARRLQLLWEVWGSIAVTTDSYWLYIEIIQKCGEKGDLIPLALLCQLWKKTWSFRIHKLNGPI